MRISVAILLLGVLATCGHSRAATDCADGMACCQRCGRPAACVETVCQVVCEVKKETKTCWCVECQEICPLLPGCKHESCECPPPPRCGHPKCVKKLVKKEYQVETPVYKCVVQHWCADCCRGGSSDVPAAAPRSAPAPASRAMPPAPIPAPPASPK
jgi:hypothetical protein